MACLRLEFPVRPGVALIRYRVASTNGGRDPEGIACQQRRKPVFFQAHPFNELINIYTRSGPDPAFRAGFPEPIRSIGFCGQYDGLATAISALIDAPSRGRRF